MLPAKFFWGSVLLRGELQKYAKNSNFENFQSALYTTSVSMPLSFQIAGYLWTHRGEVKKKIVAQSKIFAFIDISCSSKLRKANSMTTKFLEFGLSIYLEV